MGQDCAGASITGHSAGPEMHVNIIERTIRYVKEGVRGLPAGFKNLLLKLIFPQIVTFFASRLSMFASSTRTDSFSAFQLMFNMDVNATINFQLDFGAYYQVHNRLRGNAVEIPRTIGAIGVGQSNFDSGMCIFVGLHNLRLFKAKTFQLLPMPQEVISLLTSLSAADKINIKSAPSNRHCIWCRFFQ
jgi:hypothetical protein